MSCPSLETLAAWFLKANEDVDSDGVEEHIFSCDRCADRAARMEALVTTLRNTLPPVLTSERRKALEARTPELPMSTVLPGERATLRFQKGTDIGFWLMRHDLSGVERVDCELLAEDGSRMFSLPDVPFDPARQEVVLACHVHNRLLGSPEMVARLTSFRAAGGSRVDEYRLHHIFSDL